MRFPQTIDLAPCMSRIHHQLRSEKTRGPDVAASAPRIPRYPHTLDHTLDKFRVCLIQNGILIPRQCLGQHTLGTAVKFLRILGSWKDLPIPLQQGTLYPLATYPATGR